MSKDNISDSDIENEIHSDSAGTSERKELGQNTSNSCVDNSEFYKKFEKLQVRYVKLEQMHRKTKRKLKNAKYVIKRLNKKVSMN